MKTFIMKKLSIIICLVLCLLLIPTGFADEEIVDSGECGDNLTWTLDNAGTLTVSGNGTMTDYNWQSVFSPWKDSTVINNVILEDGVTSIGDCAFSNCPELTSVVIPDSVTSIGNYAFESCGGLTSVVIPDSVTSIGNGAFSYSGLTSVVIPDSVTSIGNSAFAQCSGFASMVIPDGVTSIGDYTFYECNGLTSVVIPDSVTSIGDHAFDYSGLTRVVIPDSVTSIGSYAFASCGELTRVVIPDSVTSIGNYAFESCGGLTSVVIPDSVTSIGNGVLRYSGLLSVVIPESVTSIGENAFYRCNNLSDVYYSGTEEEWEKISIELYNDSILNATLHTNCAIISPQKTMLLPEGVQEIQSKAFINIAADAVQIPDNVYNIAADAFNDGIIIIGKAGSYAQIYAEDRGLEFRIG